MSYAVGRGIHPTFRAALLAAFLWHGAALAQGVTGFADDRPFEAWYDEARADDENATALTAGLDLERDGYLSRAESEGLLPVLHEVEDLARLLSAPAGSKDATDLARLRAMLRTATASAEQWIANLRDFSRSSEARNDEEELGQALQAQARQIALENPFSQATVEVVGVVDDAGNENFYFAMGTEPGPRILTGVDDPSRVQKEIWRTAWIASALLESSRLPYMEATAATAELAAMRWSTFMNSVVADQFVWETLFNGWVGKRLPRIGGGLMDPPRHQFRLMHPTPVVAYTSEGGAQADVRLAVEVFGIRAFRRESFEPRSGLSLVAIVPGSREEDTGWGLLWTQRRFSFGIAQQEFDDGTDTTALIVGLDMAREARNEAAGLKSRFDARIACFKATAAVRIARVDANVSGAEAATAQQEACADVE